MTFVVEKKFEHKGLMCCVNMMDLGHRCGYVGVPIGHKFYGKNYTDIDNDIDCHGGLTFSSNYENDSYPLDEPNDYWWFGWDYAHCGDGIDWDSFAENFNDEIVNTRRKFILSFYGDRIYSLDNVANECIKVAEQLLKIGEN